MKNIKVIIILLIIILLIFIPFIKYGNFAHYDEAFRDGWLKCLDQLESGSLYKINHAFATVINKNLCQQGPIFFSILFLFRSISKNYFSLIVGISTILSNILILALSFLILKKENKFNIVSLLITSLLLISFIFVNEERYFGAILATLFFLIGFYFLFYSGVNTKYILGGVFFSLSLFSKISVAVAFVVLMVIYLIKFKKFNNMIFILYPIIITFIILNLIFPNFLLFPFTNLVSGVHLITSESSSTILKSTVTTLLSPRWYSIYFFIVVFLSLYIAISKLYKHNLRLYSSFVFFSFLITFLILLKLNGVEDTIIQNSLFNNKLMHILPIFILIFVLWINEINKRKVTVRITMLFLVILLSYVAIDNIGHIYTVASVNRLDTKMNFLATYLPEQDFILSDEPRWLLNKPKWTWQYDKNNRFDLLGGDVLGFLNRTEEMAIKANIEINDLQSYLENEMIMPYFTNIVTGKYSLVMFGPALSTSNIYMVLDITKKFLASISENLDNLGFSCVVYVPTLEEKCSTCRYFSTLYFRHKSDCRDLLINMVDYYNKNFDGICKRSRSAASFINKTIYVNYQYYEIYLNDTTDRSLVLFNKTCNNSKKDILNEFNYRLNRSLISYKDIYLFSSLFIATIVVEVYFRKKKL